VNADKAARSVFEREETVSSWDEDYYHPISERYYDRAVADMLSSMGVKTGDAVLDAGCGPGVHSIRAARFGAKVSAIDFSERMLSHARARARKAGVLDAIDFSRGDLTDLPIESGRHPFVFSWGVVVHIPDAEAALDNLARVLAPGGKFALQVLNEQSLDYRIEKLARIVLGKPFAGLERTSLGTGLWYDYHDERLWVQRFNTAKLIGALEKRGLRLVSRRGAEFTEFQRRAPRFLRPFLLHLNNAAYALRLPPSLFCTHILVFEKAA